MAVVVERVGCAGRRQLESELFVALLAVVRRNADTIHFRAVVLTPVLCDEDDSAI